MTTLRFRVPLVLASFLLVHCSTIDSSTGYRTDPFRSPYQRLTLGHGQAQSQQDVVLHRRGAEVLTNTSNVKFYTRYSRFGGIPKYNFVNSVPVQVLGSKGVYTKVQLKSGERGYIKTKHLSERNRIKPRKSSYKRPKKSKFGRKETQKTTPNPPTEKEILERIRRKAKKKRTSQRKQKKISPVTRVLPSQTKYVAPEPEILGVRPPKTSYNQLSIPTIPTQESPNPAVSPPKVESVTDYSIKINKPNNIITPPSIESSQSILINQDSSLE